MKMLDKKITLLRGGDTRSLFLEEAPSPGLVSFYSVSNAHPALGKAGQGAADRPSKGQ